MYAGLLQSEGAIKATGMHFYKGNMLTASYDPAPFVSRESMWKIGAMRMRQDLHD
jgi:hypothetical protein